MAKVESLVNKFGKMAGWNSVTVNLFGRDLEAIQEIGYDDNVEVEHIYGAGQMPIGYGDGNYKANCKLVVNTEELINILDAIPEGKRISDSVPTDVTVQYEYQDRIVTDTCRNFRITGLGKEVKQGDKVVGQALECFLTHIDWNVK